MLKVRDHPGWTYVPGSLDDQPQHLLDLEDELNAAQRLARKRRGEAASGR